METCRGLIINDTENKTTSKKKFWSFIKARRTYASLVVLVVKKDKTYYRFCIDFRRLNNLTKFHAEPLPDQTYLFTRLQKAIFISKIDLTKGYWQVPVPEKDCPKTAFVTHSGLYQ